MQRTNFQRFIIIKLAINIDTRQFLEEFILLSMNRKYRAFNVCLVLRTCYSLAGTTNCTKRYSEKNSPFSWSCRECAWNYV